MKYEIWIDRSGECDDITLIDENNNKESISENATLFDSFEADDYNSAMQKYHDIMGWEKYIPF